MKASFSEFVEELDDDVPTPPARLAQIGIEQSGWEDALPALFDRIRASQKNRRVKECVARTLDAMLFYLAQFPPLSEEEDLKNNIKGLEALKKGFNKNADKLMEQMRGDLEENLQYLLRELPEAILDRKFLADLKKSSEDLIDAEKSFSAVPGKLKAKFKDYLETRCGWWCNEVQNFQSRQSQVVVKMCFEENADALREWIKNVAEQNQMTFIPEIPQAALPQFDFTEFRDDFESAFGRVVDIMLTPDWSARFVTWVSEAIVVIKDRFISGWNELVSFFTDSASAESKPSPRFDKAKAKRQLREDLDKLFEKDSLQYLLVADPDAYRKFSFGEWFGAVIKAISESDWALENVTEKAVEIVEREREELIATPKGPILVVAETILSDSTEAFQNWEKAVLSTLHHLIANLGKQQNKLPTPLTPQMLQKLEHFLGDLEAFLAGNNDLQEVMTQTRQAIAARSFNDKANLPRENGQGQLAITAEKQAYARMP